MSREIKGGDWVYRVSHKCTGIFVEGKKYKVGEVDRHNVRIEGQGWYFLKYFTRATNKWWKT